MGTGGILSAGSSAGTAVQATFLPGGTGPTEKTAHALVISLLAIFVLVAAPGAAAAKQCFGKKVNRVVKGKNKTVRLKFKDVTWVAGDGITVIAKPYSHVCANRGRQFVRAGKGRTFTSTGKGADRITLHRSSNDNVVKAGTGNDLISGSKGNDRLYGGPKSVERGVADRDTINGHGGNDHIFDFAGTGNRLYGSSGSDRLHSTRSAISSVYGGNGSDFIFSDGGISSTGRSERLFGERGNDRLNASRSRSDGPAFLDGGAGDDWINGTSFDDTVIVHSGIVKIRTGAGDDLIVATSAGRVTVDGGPGRDTMSWATHTPADKRNYSGVDVNLAGGTVGGVGIQRLVKVEDVVGSSFDDTITGRPGVTNRIHGGLGDDSLIGQRADGDVADGGFGLNECQGFGVALNCGANSPGDIHRSRVLVDIDESGVLTVIGSRSSDRIGVAYDRAVGSYVVSSGSGAVPSGLCRGLDRAGRGITCPAGFNNLNGVLVYGNDGADRIKVENSVPAFVTTTINGGGGKNTLIGGKSKDVISTGPGSRGTVIKGKGNLDQLYVPAGGVASGGGSSDVIHSQSPCDGGKVRGGKGNDNLVFAGSRRGVRADLAKGYARYVRGRCRRALRVGGDVESLEGTKYNDVLTLGRKLKSQSRKRSLFGREGNDRLDSRNGFPDTVTTGGGNRNRVKADRADKVIRGYGLSGY